MAIDDSPLRYGMAGKPASDASRNGFVRTIVEKHERDLLSFLRKRFGDGPPEPGDVAQQAFVQIAALEQPQILKNPRAFLFRTALNIAIDHKRRNARQEKILRENFSLLAAEPTADFDPERVLLSKDELQVLHQAVEDLPERDRVFLLLNRLEGLSYAEIGRRTKLAPSSVRYIIEGALKKCQSAMQHELQDD